MTLFGSSARLIAFTTGHALPISVGTSSASPSRVAPWQAVIEPPYFERHLGDLALAAHPGLPSSPRRASAPRCRRRSRPGSRAHGLCGAARVGEHAPVVEDAVALAVAGDDRVPLLAHLREHGVVERRVLAVPGHRSRPGRRGRGRAAASRSGRGARPSRRRRSRRRGTCRRGCGPSFITTFDAGSTSHLAPYIATATTACTLVGLRDVGLVVAAQVARSSTRRRARRRRSSPARDLVSTPVVS